LEELKVKYDKIMERNRERTKENEEMIRELDQLAEKAFNVGNYYIAAESLNQGAKILYENSTPEQEDIKRQAAIKYDKASRRYHAVNQFREAAESIEKAADIYIEIFAMRQASNCYALAKNYYGDSGNYDKCGEAYIKEMDCKKNHFWSLARRKKGNKLPDFFRYLKYEVFKMVTGYGEKFTNLIISSLLINVVFIAYYFFSNSVIVPGADKTNSFFFDSNDKWGYFLACLKFSISLFSGFSTTPYLLIKNNWISTFEVLIGNVVLALFIAIILRKISRR